MNPEVDELHAIFDAMLRQASGDGQTKRQAGLKPLWKDDESHEGALRRHLARWELDRGGLDVDSNAPHLVHVAWRALALAWREANR